MKEPNEKSELCSRRSILKGSTMLLGGIAGRISNAYGIPEPYCARVCPLVINETALGTGGSALEGN